ncbi:MAG: 1,2-phenylacetyl-CoA epoxidase subunit PaaC [Flavobacteriales bacterium]|nr:1,2-phenylacetyl-CoA epoxidase subunit PaaC [Flavobacteriales bacterium]
MSQNNALLEYVLRLGDNTLILGQRLSEWCGHGPVLEEDIALTNHALDYLGQATLMMQYASKVQDEGKDEDQIAFLRDAPEYKNILLVELPNGDYAHTVARQFLFSAWYSLVLENISSSSDEFLASFAVKSLKEVKYHLQHSSDWVLRLGDGTEESHRRMQDAIDKIWPYTGEMFTMDSIDQLMFDQKIGPNFISLKAVWLDHVKAILEEAGLTMPPDAWSHSGGKQGRHTEHLGFILSDMQFLQRAYPGAKW